MNYSWEILKLGTRDETNSNGDVLEDSIVYVQWKKIATDVNGNVATYLSESKFSAADVSLDGFIALYDVTKENVVGWIENSLTEEQTKMINNVLAKKLEEKYSKTIIPNW